MIDAARRLAGNLEATRYASRLGLRTGDLLGDAATASLPYAADLANAQGHVHGGASASLSLWVAMLAAVASDREQTRFASPVSLGLSYLAAAREEALYATGRVSARGRDIAHVEIEVCSERGRIVALALAVLRLRAEVPAARSRAGSFASAPARPVRALVSPFSRAMGIELRSSDHSAATLAMPADVNEGVGGFVDPGALVSLADTCAALACMPSLDQRMLGSATLSLSAVFAAETAANVVATGHVLAEDSGVCSAVVEVHGDDERDASGRSARRAAMTAGVSYRFLSAGTSR